MTSTEPIWMTRQQYARLRNKLNALRSGLIVETPDDTMDFDANRVALQRRIREIQKLLSKAIIGQNPAGDTIAEPGMVLTIRYDVTGETETFLLGRRGSEGAEIKVYSMASPLGRAIAGARPGDQRIYSIPDETGRLVTLLEAVPYEMHLTKRNRSQKAHRDPTVTATRVPTDRERPGNSPPQRPSRRTGVVALHTKESSEYYQRATRVDFAAQL
jgi:transcription elongation factor GreA